jgi:hypothetical protein
MLQYLSSTFCPISKFRYIFVHRCTFYWCSASHLVTPSFQFSVRRRYAAVVEISIAPTPASSLAKAFTATKHFEQMTMTNLRTTSAAAAVAAFNPRTMSAFSAACQRAAKPAALADFFAKASAAA